MNDLKTTIL